MHQTAKGYGQRPSDLLALPPDDFYLAWMIDQAVGHFGRTVEAKLTERVPVKKHGKVVGDRPRYSLHQLLDIKPDLASREQLIAALG